MDGKSRYKMDVSCGDVRLYPLPCLLRRHRFFKTNAELTLGNALFPEQWHYENYIYAFQQLDFGLYTFNSVALALLTVVLSVLTSSMAGYVIGRRQFAGKKLLTGMYLASMFISVGSVALYPLYKLLNGLGLTSNLIGLALI